MKALPIGVDNFKKLIEKDYYYFDKSKLIEDILEDKAEVTLFTRPRRFGKTLNMSLIRYFFDIKNGEENKKLFDNLYISKTKYMEKQGKYPVITVTFKGIRGNNWEECYKKTKTLLSDLYDEHNYIRDKLSERDLAYFDNIWYKRGEEDFENALRNLTKYLESYYNEKVILLIDEYDMPIINGYIKGFKKEVIEFYRELYGEALKGNNSLEFSVMTGILRIAKEGIFSGLNHVKMKSIFSEEFSEHYGLTEKEVEESLKYYNISDRLDEVKEWYDGYTFGKSEVYNPWSIINYLDTKSLVAHWINTSGNDLIKEILENASEETFEDLEKLFNKEIIEKSLDNYVEFTMGEKEIWEILVYSGYLTQVGHIESEWGKIYKLKIPNKEILVFFYWLFIYSYIDKNNRMYLRNIIKYLEKGEIEKFGELLERELLSSLSYLDTVSDEKYYKIFLIGILIMFSNRYIRISEQESGYGRSDLILEPKNKKEKGYIFEFKVAKNEEELENKAKEGLKQINDKKYETLLKNRGVNEIVKISMAFYKKKVKVEYEI